jgi:hypothetical protein
MLKLLNCVCVQFAQTSLVLTLASITAWAAPATVSTFTGGDPGEGLDLQGNFAYAINVGPNGAVGKVGDAAFLGDTVAGVNITAQNAYSGWHNAAYGNSTNDNSLELVMRDMRWSAAPATPIVRLAVEQGINYKLQLLFAENASAARAFDIMIEGNLEVDEFNPASIQGTNLVTGLPDNTKGVVVTFEFTSADTELEIILDGAGITTPEFTDINPILNGLTLERLSPATDTDTDGLPDDWERRYFTNLVSIATGDPDSDGLNNAAELAAGTIPTEADTDNDGLNDGLEVNTLHTDPLRQDSDGDGLMDAAEVNIHQTDPTKADTDGDGFSDFDELRLLTDPKSAQSKPKNTLIGLFTGADAGEGLDLQGTFPYAVDTGPLGAAGGQIGGALFTDESAEGVMLVSGNKTGAWNGGITYGSSPEDDVLEEMMSSISWSDATAPVSTVQLTFTNLQVGAAYKLQLLFAEQEWPRGFDIHINGAQVADDFCPAFYQGSGFPMVLPCPDSIGAVLTHSFIARNADVRVVLDGKTTTTPEFTDHNAILNGATLELVAPNVDSDGDTLPDPWEIDAFGNLAQTAAGDPDLDGLPNSGEFASNTDPNDSDTDDDGLSDGAEVNTHHTDPLKADTDGDGLTDAAEINTHLTDPLKADSDNDRLSDGDEIIVHHTNPLKADTDDDGVNDFDELRLLTDPTKSQSISKTTSVGIFTGGDAGEGLDLDGNFIYAFSAGTENAAGQVRDAVFTGQTVEGVTIAQATAMIEGWFTADLGVTPNDDALELAVGSIRHGGGGARITLSNLVVGAGYKLQLLFGEQASPRGFDVQFDGRLIVDEFAPFVYQGGIDPVTLSHTKLGAVITHNFIARTNTVEVRTVGGTVTTAAYTDHNPIINAVTLEQTSAALDSDGDNLSDSWENLWFGNLVQTGSGNPDGDGLTNEEEEQFGSDPTMADADGDGLLDQEEKSGNTDPFLADTDGDGLRDDAEVKIHHTNPRLQDTDSDGRSDLLEVTVGTNPLVPDLGVFVGAFTGGDPGEGLDLDGTFVYAFDIVLPTGTPLGQVRGAVFTEEDAPGITVTAQNNIPVGGWGTSEYGDTPSDDVLELIMQSIRWSGAPASVNVTLANLTPGKRYKLQLLFYENCCARAFDVKVEGVTIVDEFAPFVVQGGIGNLGQGALVAQEFTATHDTLTIELAGASVTTPAYTDHNATLSGVTLEDLGIAPPVGPRITGTSLQGGVAITFESINAVTYFLEYKASLGDATWQPAGSITATGASTTVRDDVAAHLTGATGFWRLRVP